MKNQTSAISKKRRKHNFQNPWKAISEWGSEMDNLFTNFLHDDDINDIDFTPSCDFTEQKNQYLATFDLPGVKKRDLKIEVEDNRITVRGERTEQKEEKNHHTYLSETYRGKFMRSFSLPGTVDTDNVDAHFEDGVLTVTMPKIKPAQTKEVAIH